MNEISIVIPIYNEEKNLPLLLEEINNVLKKKIAFEIVAIDDGSDDNSLIYLKKNQFNFKVKIIENKNNLGQSYSIYRGIKEAKYNNIVTIDADLQNNPKDIEKLTKIYFNDDYSLVGGLRKYRKDNIVKKISSKIANYVRRLILKDNCKDTGCSLKIFSKKIFLKFPYFDGIHRFLPALYAGYGYSTFFTSVDHRSRIYGNSKYGTIKRLFKGLYDIYRVYKIIKKYNKVDNVSKSK